MTFERMPTGQKITREMLSGRVVFLPGSHLEAREIQRHLFKMGVHWLQGGQTVESLETCVREGMVVVENTLRHSPRRDVHAVLCDLSNFDADAVIADADADASPPDAAPPPSEPRAVLTPEFCKTARKKIMFYPADGKEALAIVAELSGMGFHFWRSDMAGQVGSARKIFLDTDKTIMVSTDNPDRINAEVYTLEDFFLIRKPSLAEAQLMSETLVFFPSSYSEAHLAV